VERETQALFTAQVLQEGARRFGVMADELKYVGVYGTLFKRVQFGILH
jgi:hypothetical protein